MSHGLTAQFNKSVSRDKRGREIKTEEDLLSKRLRHSDGTFGTYRGGKLIAKEDAPAAQSKFHAPTPVATLVAKEPEPQEKINRVEKRFDVNAPAMKL